MTDEYTGQDQPQPPEVPGTAASPGTGQPPAADAWREVVAQADALSHAIGVWAKSAYNDPEFRRHADEIGSKLSEMGSRIGETMQDAADSDLGQKVSQTADKVGDALTEGADKVTKAAGPHVASAFASMSAALQKAAGSVEEAVHKRDTREPGKTAGAAPAPPIPPIPPTDDEPR